MTNHVTRKTLSISAAQSTATGWIPINSYVPGVQVTFQVENEGTGVVPVINVEGTLANVLASGSVAATEVFSMVSGISSSATGVTLVAGAAFIPNAARLKTITGAGSGASVLNFSVLQTGV